MRLLVTGGAGFIGSNFVRYWVEQQPGDHVVAYDLLTYAGDRRNLADLGDRIEFVQGDIGDADLAAATLREHEIDTIVNFAAESHNSLAVLDPTRFFRTNVLGTQALLEAARRNGVERFHHVSTCEVYGDLALDSDEVFTEESPVPPAHAVQRVEGGRRPRRAGLQRDVRAPGDDHQLLEQLRAVPVSREGDPALRHERARRRAAADVRVHGEQARVAARPRSLPRDRARARRRADRRDLQRRLRRREERSSEIADLVLDIDRQAGQSEDDRPGPARARPPLPARLDQAPVASSAGSRRSASSRGSRRPCAGTRRTATGGSR